MSGQDIVSPSDPVIDMDSLLKPCPGADPAGRDIRYDGTYDRIKELRRADEDLSLGEWRRQTKRSDWKKVAEVAQAILTSKSKDLMIALWLWEALAHQYGFAGLRDGCHIVRRLMEEYWEGIYPRIEDDDLAARAAGVEWIGRVLSHWLRVTPLFGNGGIVVSLSNWQEADRLEQRDPEERAELIGEGKLTLESINRILAGIESDQLKHQQADLLDARVAVEGLDEIVARLYGNEAPSLRGLFSAIDECAPILHRAVQLKTLDNLSDREESEIKCGLGVAVQEKTLAADRFPVPADREDALQRLEYIANYFEKTEPYSPVPYAIRRAIRWAQMPLDQWLSEVVPDDVTLRLVRRALGLDVSGERK